MKTLARIFGRVSNPESAVSRRRRLARQLRPEGVERFEDRVLLSTVGPPSYDQFGRLYPGEGTVIIGPRVISTDTASHTASLTVDYTGTTPLTVSIVEYCVTQYPVSPGNLNTQVLLTSNTVDLHHGTNVLSIAVSPDACNCPYIQFDAVVGQPINLQTFVSPNGYGPYDQTIFASAVVPSAGLCPHDQPTPTEGLTIGYWKTHDASSLGVGLSTPLSSLGFDVAALGPNFATMTVGDALNLQGGPTTLDKMDLMLKQAVGSYMNALAFGSAFGMSTTNVVDLTNALLVSTDVNLINYYQGFFEALNSVDVGNPGLPNSQKSK